jgi:hypothetical protein
VGCRNWGAARVSAMKGLAAHCITTRYRRREHNASSMSLFMPASDLER